MSSDDFQRIIPLAEEVMHVEKREVVTDHLRVSTHVEQRPVIVESTLERGSLHVERIVLDRAVSQAPEPRQDGDTLVISVVEERAVVEKRLFVIEEIRITRKSTTTDVSIPETIRTMRATIEHVDAALSKGEIDG